MSVIWHHHPCAQFVALTIKVTDRAGGKVRKFRVTEMASAVAGIEVFVHAAGIPPEQFLLLVPGERTFCGHRLLNDGVALLFETKQDLLRKRARLAKRDELSAAIALQVRKHTPRMESGDEMVWMLRVSHG